MESESHEYSSMQPMSSIMEKYLKNSETKKHPPHEKAASVDEILKVVAQTKTYGYTYWLSKVGTASYSKVLEICKEAKDMPFVMRGGYITNQLKPYAIKKARKIAKKKDESTNTEQAN